MFIQLDRRRAFAPIGSSQAHIVNCIQFGEFAKPQIFEARLMNSANDPANYIAAALGRGRR